MRWIVERGVGVGLLSSTGNTYDSYSVFPIPRLHETKLIVHRFSWSMTSATVVASVEVRRPEHAFAAL
jgi:hypothetical protein